MDSPWNHDDGATFACVAESALIYQERVIKYERDGLRFQLVMALPLKGTRGANLTYRRLING
jgi:hypothetical protein